MARLPRGGRSKTELKRIENERERAVTLSKRRNDLFKKASELATLCGVQIAIILFSISGKPLSFGSPSVHSVINKYRNSNEVDQQPNDFITRFVNSYHEFKLQELNQEFNEVNERLVKEKKRRQMLDESIEEGLLGKTYEKYMGNIGICELTQLKYKMEKLKRNVEIILESNVDATSRSSSSSDECEADLSKIGGPKDYLKL